MAYKVLILDEKGSADEALQEAFVSNGFETYCAASTEDGIQIAMRYHPDVVLLYAANADEELPALEKLVSIGSLPGVPVIVLTESRDIDRFRKIMLFGAESFLPSPFVPEDVLRLIQIRLQKKEMMKEALADELTGAASERSKKPDHILVKIGSRLRLIEFTSMVCITALKEHSKCTTQDGTKIVIRKSLRQWEETLPPNAFLRIHRATIINIAFIDKIEKTGFRSYTVSMKCTKQTFPLSSRYANSMKKTFGM